MPKANFTIVGSCLLRQRSQQGFVHHVVHDGAGRVGGAGFLVGSELRFGVDGRTLTKPSQGHDGLSGRVVGRYVARGMTCAQDLEGLCRPFSMPPVAAIRG